MTEDASLQSQHQFLRLECKPQHCHSSSNRQALWPGAPDSLGQRWSPTLAPSLLPIWASHLTALCHWWADFQFCSLYNSISSLYCLLNPPTIFLSLGLCIHHYHFLLCFIIVQKTKFHDNHKGLTTFNTLCVVIFKFITCNTRHKPRRFLQ